MKTAIQDFIDEAIKYSRELSTEGYLNESLAVDHIIDLAESLLEKEKEVMSQVYADGGDWDEVPQPRFKNYYNQTFKTKEND